MFLFYATWPSGSDSCRASSSCAAPSLHAFWGISSGRCLIVRGVLSGKALLRVQGHGMGVPSNASSSLTIDQRVESCLYCILYTM